MADSAPPCTPTPSTFTLDGGFHQGGTFLAGFYSHLKTRAGGNRGEHSATQIARYIGKYLYAVNPDRVVEGQLLNTHHLLPYLNAVYDSGIGSSGVLHRILAHKAAIHYMRLSVSHVF